MKAKKNILESPIFDKNKITTIGSIVVDDDGVVSGFSESNFVRIPMPNLAQYTTWEIVCKFKMNSVDETGYKFTYASADGKQVITQSIYNKTLGMAIGNSTASAWQITESNGAHGSTVIQPNIDYWSKIKFTGASYDLMLSTDGVNYNLEYSFSSSQKVTYNSSYNFNIGIDRGSDKNFPDADIYLKEFMIIGDGNVVYQPVRVESWFLPYIRENYYGIGD